MSLPPKSEKGYLQLHQSERGLWAAGKKEHMSELATLYGQYGICYRQEQGGNPEEDVLTFEKGVDQAQVKQILEAYRDAKGS